MNFHEMDWETKKAFIKEYFARPLDSINEVSSGTDSDDYTLDETFRNKLKEHRKTSTQVDFVSIQSIFSIPTVIVTPASSNGDSSCSHESGWMSDKGGSGNFTEVDDGIDNTQMASEEENSCSLNESGWITDEDSADETNEISRRQNREDESDSLNESGWITNEDSSENLNQSNDDNTN